MTPVRTRIAPSPTGEPHVGTAYIALFNLCFARQHGGQFILRIEDTDQQRSSAASEAKILQALRWIGLQWDEGPDVGGPHAPYRQSERSAIYREHAQRLVHEGHAFHCFCKADRLDGLRREQMARGENPGYDGHCLQLSQAEVSERLAAGESSVIRMKVPRQGVCHFDDLLRGRIEIPWSQVDMQVLLKADGLPTYHLANVVDDHLMQITHVIRGEEWISSAPKHQLLYQYFAWQMPILCHMPLLRNPDKSKLSKRKNPTSILHYQRMGYLPQALLNYLARMGWSMPDEREKFRLDEMIADFDIARVSLGGPIFALDKLDWLNALWLRELSPQQLLQALIDWRFHPDYLHPVLAQVQPRLQRLSDIIDWGGFFFRGLLSLQVEQFEHKKLTPVQVRCILQCWLWASEKSLVWNHDFIAALCQELSERMELKLRDFMAPLFVAIAGARASTPVMEAMALLGNDVVRARLRHALDLLGPASQAEVLAWEPLLQGCSVMSGVPG